MYICAHGREQWVMFVDWVCWILLFYKSFMILLLLFIFYRHCTVSFYRIKFAGNKQSHVSLSLIFWIICWKYNLNLKFKAWFFISKNVCIDMYNVHMYIYLGVCKNFQQKHFLLQILKFKWVLWTFAHN